MIDGARFMASDSTIPHQFGFSPATSFFVDCHDEIEFDVLYEHLAQLGDVMMPPGSYGFGTKFAWVGDRYGVSWQLNLA
jgi:predicted 3-demethylubiquinone-9 3-methyltransferase (glyoxalase superfamily)